MIKGTPLLITVFGGGGFIGRYVCEYLLKSGARVRVAQRQPKTAYFLQPLGQVGQIQFAAADVTRPDSVALAVTGADTVINLVAVMDGKMEAINAGGAANIARAAAESGAKALVHISAIGADSKGEARYAQSKGDGEVAVRKHFAKTTIVRPSIVFGPEDALTNRFAGLLALLPVYPVIAPDTKFQPVYVRDLAQAIAAAALDPSRHAGQTYEIGGPEVLTMRELTRQIGTLAGQDTSLIDMPSFGAAAIARMGFLPGAPLTWDQWLMLQKDNVVASKASGLADFGIAPTPLSSVAGEWLGRFVEGGRFAARATPLDA
jgi:NADH dehydrogenase